MIVEKRKRIRNPKPADLDLVVELNFSESGSWEDDVANEIISPLIVLAFALLIGLSAFAIGSYLF